MPESQALIFSGPLGLVFLAATGALLKRCTETDNYDGGGLGPGPVSPGFYLVTVGQPLSKPTAEYDYQGVFWEPVQTFAVGFALARVTKEPFVGPYYVGVDEEAKAQLLDIARDRHLSEPCVFGAIGHIPRVLEDALRSGLDALFGTVLCWICERPACNTRSAITDRPTHAGCLADLADVIREQFASEQP